MRQNAVDEVPSELADLLFALRIPEDVLAFLRDGHVGVHAAAVHAHHRLGQERRRHPQLVRHLAAISLYSWIWSAAWTHSP